MLTEKEKEEIAQITLNQSTQFNKFVTKLYLLPLLVDAITNAEFLIIKQNKKNANDNTKS
jgi:hypothetical protein